MKVGVVQRVNIRAQSLSQRVRQLVLIFDGRNRVKMRLQRRQPFGFNARFIHVSVVEIGDLATVRACRRFRLGGLFNDRGRALVRQVSQRT